MMGRKRRFWKLFLLLGLLPSAWAAEVPFDSERWQLRAREAEVKDYLGRRSLYLKGGVALVKDANFLDGVIEFDIAFSGERGFMGAIWRVQDRANYEEFYLRPHQSGNPDANQYTPVFHGASGWQLYHGAGYGAPVPYVYDQWMAVRIVVAGGQAEVYIRDLETPALFIPELKRAPAAGMVGLSAGNFAPAYFSNFRFHAGNPPAFKGKAPEPKPIPKGAIMAWHVSDGFAWEGLAGQVRLGEKDRADLSWKRLACESNGLLNLARRQGIDGVKNTLFAKITLVSERDQIKKLRFGYSDRVLAYLNRELLFEGDHRYQSRDYRYLGTVGLHDALYLPLKKGENELWMAVGERFGGWGLWAAIEDREGIEIR